MLKHHVLLWLVLFCWPNTIVARPAKLSYVDSGACCFVADGKGNSFIVSPSGTTKSIVVSKVDSNGDLVSRSEVELKITAVLWAAAVDPQGHLWIAGKVLLTPAWSVGLLLELAATGAEVLSMTTLGGQDPLGGTEIHAIAFDPAGNCYVAGSTTQVDFPLTSGSYVDKTPVVDGAPLRAYRGFVAKLKREGQDARSPSIVYSTLLGGTEQPVFVDISALAVHGDGIVTVAGVTSSPDFPTTTGAFRNTFAVGPGLVFVTRLNAEGSGLLWSTFVGPGSALPVRLGVDSMGNPVLSGATADPLYPTTAAAVQPRFQGQPGYYHIFLSKLDSSGSRMLFSTFYGLGSSPSTPRIDGNGDIWLTATADDASSVVLAPNSLTLGRSAIAQFSADGSKVLFSELLPSGVAGKDLSLNPDGSMTIAGNGFVIYQSRSAPSGLSILGVTDSAGLVVTKSMAPGEYISIFGTDLGPLAGVGMELDATGRIARTLAGTQVVINGAPVPLLYVSSNQINALAPYRMEVGTQPTLKVVTAADSSQTLPLDVVRAQPNIFTIRNADGSVNSRSHPAPVGSTVTVFVSGAGALDMQFPDGTLTAVPTPSPALSVSATVGCSLGRLLQSALVRASSASSVAGVEVNMLRAQFQIPEGIWTSTGCSLQVVIDHSVVQGTPVGIRSEATVLFLIP